MFEHGRRPQGAWAAGDAAAGMASASTQIEPADGRRVTGAGWTGTNKQLIKAVVAVIDVPAGDSILLLDIDGCKHFSGNDRLSDRRCVTFEGCHDNISKALALFVVPSAVQIIRNEMNEERHHAMPRRREIGVGNARDVDVKNGSLREPPILDGVERAFHFIPCLTGTCVLDGQVRPP